MKEIAEKLRLEERRLAERKGPFDLFALFLREDAFDKWDLVASAKWIDKNKSDALKLLTRRVQSVLTKEEVLKLSRVVLIEESDPVLRAWQSAMKVEHGLAEIQDSNFFGLPIKHAYLITSQKRNAA